MAKKYLDDTGMSYFWGKLKAYFQEKLVSGTNIKTINNETLLGSGNISVTAERIERGSNSFNVTGTTEASTYIAFSEQYDTAPTVMVTLMASYNRRIDVSAVSAYGFTVNGALLSGTSQAAIPFMWLAVGK